jgi:hypothetical protein
LLSAVTPRTILTPRSQVVLGTADNAAVAYGSYDLASNHISNFAVLKIETNASYSDEIQFYGAGYLEAAFTYGDIYNMYQNLLPTLPWGDAAPPTCMTDWLSQQDAYQRAQIANPTGDVLFWQQLGLVMSQVWCHAHHGVD